MMFAKHKDAERGLHALFRERRVRKLYRASTPVAAARAAYRWRDTLDWRGKARTAATTAFLCKTEGNRMVWTVLPHQIRKHFALSDAVMGRPRVRPRVYGAEEVLGLACVEYRFRHPITEERVTIRRSGGPE